MAHGNALARVNPVKRLGRTNPLAAVANGPDTGQGIQTDADGPEIAGDFVGPSAQPGPFGPLAATVEAPQPEQPAGAAFTEQFTVPAPDLPAVEERTGLQRFVKNLGIAGISLATGIPGIELKRLAAQNDMIAAQTEGKQAELTAASTAAQKDLQIQALSSIAFDPNNPNADAALRQIFRIDPELGNEAFEAIGAIDQRQREEASRDARAILATPFNQRPGRFRDRAASLDRQGRDSTETRQLAGLDEATQNRELRILANAPLDPQRVTAPTTRTRIEGEESIVEQFNAGTGQFEEVSRGPRGTLQRIEQGEPGAFANLNAPEMRDAQDRVSSSVDSINTANDLATLIRERPGLVGITGNFSRAVNNFTSTVKGLANIVFTDNQDVSVGFENLSNTANYDFGTTFDNFQGTAQDSEVAKSLMISLAISGVFASGQTRISDQDVQQQLRALGGLTSDPVAALQVLSSYTNRIARRTRTSNQANRINRPDLDSMLSGAIDEFNTTIGQPGTQPAALTLPQITEQLRQRFPTFDQKSAADQQEMIELLQGQQ